MKEIFGEMLQNKNFLMFAATVSYVLGLFAFFTDKPVLFAGIFTLFSVLLLFKDFPRKIVIIWIAIFYFGFFNATLRIKNYDDLFKLAPSDATISGQIVSIPNGNTKHNTKFFFVVDEITTNGKTYKDIHNKTLVGVNDFSDNPNFSNLVIGDKYVLNGKLRRPFMSTNPSQFSYAGYLKNFRVYTTFYTDIDNISKIDSSPSVKWKVIQYLNTKRNSIIKAHSKYLKSPNIDILGGVIFGDDAISPPDYIKASFIHSGLLHILAASGMNVAFISGFLFFFLFRFRVPYNISISIGILSTILYCLMTGLGPSVIRAGLMLIFVLFGKLIDRDSHSVSMLSFVGMLMLIYNPAFINDVGFQLSFVVTLGIIITGEAVYQYVKNIPNWLSGAVLIPIIAQLWVVPIQMFYFNTISTYSIIANIISMPFLYVISFGGFLSAVFSLYEPIADIVCRGFDIVLNPCLNVLVYISDYIAKLPHSLHYTTHPSVIQLIIYYIILVMIVHFIDKRFENKKLLIPILSMVLVLFLSATLHLPNHNFEVIAFDVGNADAFLLKTPRGKYFIIDTGKMGYNGGRSQGDMLILKYLRDKGIKNIEGMILTHFDSDHAGGAVDLIRGVSVKNVFVNNLHEDKNLARSIYKEIGNSPYTNKVLGMNGSVICNEPSLKIKLLKANIPEHGHDSESNENSLITYVESDKTSILFMGDAGVKAFNQIKSDLPQNVTVLKVGHHGARNVVDKEMLEYLNPEISLLSVGFNKYGHPNPLTIKMLSGTKIVRTDKIHAIKIISSARAYEIDGYDSKTRKFYKKYSKKL